MITIMILMFTLSVTFLLLKHPVTLSMTILLQTILMALMTGMMTFNFWFSYILLLTMIGGLLVLFLYMTNVASNEKFNFSKKIVLMWISSLFLFMMISPWMNNMYMNTKLFSNKNNMEFWNMMNKFYNLPFNLMLILIMIILLLTLIMTVKISEINKGPLRKKH
uniref:NADH-ubiquinone oxidoreductase chain 6 n=1 Tax=Agonita chinensis TaxID=2003340 RepID=A0A343SEN5_9CUCU|nr:NADH dehydrogenase subunit 6 [Agonita chinensis]